MDTFSFIFGGASSSSSISISSSSSSSSSSSISSTTTFGTFSNTASSSFPIPKIEETNEEKGEEWDGNSEELDDDAPPLCYIDYKIMQSM